MTQAVPAFVADKRAAKADRIAQALASRGVGAAEAARLTDGDRRQVEAEVGVRRSSGRTWRSVVEMLAGSTLPEARCMTCGLGDPAGVPGPPKPYGHTGPCAR